jgi:hypothetical protein
MMQYIAIPIHAMTDAINVSVDISMITFPSRRRGV